MSLYYLDSSALVKRYVNETGTAWVVSITDSTANNRIHIARITGVEVVSAITRRTRSGSITVTDANTAIALFRHDFLNNYTVTEIAPALINYAMQLAKTHALRGYDAVQLAAAMDVNAYGLSSGIPKLILVSADSDLNAAAVAEGLNADDPNAHP